MPEAIDPFRGYTIGGLTQICASCTYLQLALGCLGCGAWCWSCPRCDVLATLCRPCACRALWEPLWAPI